MIDWTALAKELGELAKEELEALKAELTPERQELLERYAKIKARAALAMIQGEDVGSDLAAIEAVVTCDLAAIAQVALDRAYQRALRNGLGKLGAFAGALGAGVARGAIRTLTGGLFG